MAVGDDQVLTLHRRDEVFLAAPMQCPLPRGQAAVGMSPSTEPGAGGSRDCPGLKQAASLPAGTAPKGQPHGRRY